MRRSRPLDRRVPVAVSSAAVPAASGEPQPRPTPYPRTAGDTLPTPLAVDVWALVRRAQDREAEAFGLLDDHDVTVVFRYLPRW